MLFLLLACGGSAPENPCVDDAGSVATDAGELACARAKIPSRYLRVLSGRSLPPGTTASVVAAVVERRNADPEATDAWLDEVAASGRGIEQATGLEAAELRSAALWRAYAGEGPLHVNDPKLGTLVRNVVSVRARDDEEKLALTENDIESWITYASLCHEAQGGGVLRLSVANKVNIYTMVQQRFEHGDRAEMVALASFGPTWGTVVKRWKAASYHAQQAWIADAPLPPPVAASSLGYFETVIEGDVVNAARAIHRRFGPLHFRDGPGYFTGSP